MFVANGLIQAEASEIEEVNVIGTLLAADVLRSKATGFPFPALGHSSGRFVRSLGRVKDASQSAPQSSSQRARLVPTTRIAMLRPTIARSGWRAATRGSAQARPLPFAPAAKRFASSSAKEEAKSDLPWIISSVALFGSVGFYMTTPSKKSAHHAAPKERQQRLPSLPLPDDDPQPKAEEASDDDQDEAAEDDSGPSGPAGEAGEGKPHGEPAGFLVRSGSLVSQFTDDPHAGTGDNHLRELSQNSDEHSTKQKSKGEAKDLQVRFICPIVHTLD